MVLLGDMYDDSQRNNNKLVNHLHSDVDSFFEAYLHPVAVVVSMGQHLLWLSSAPSNAVGIVPILGAWQIVLHGATHSLVGPVSVIYNYY
jgi:hypothetical protein